MLLGILLAACSGGDNGKDGADGGTGPVGPPGPPGEPGPSSGNGVPIDSADKINIAVTSVAIPAGGGAPTIQLTLTNDLTQGLRELPATDIRFVLSQLTPGSNGGSSEWQSYVTRSSNGVANAQATTETATAGTFVDNSDGTYVYTFAKALTDYAGGPAFDATKTHRLGVEIRGQAPISSNGIYDFVPAGGAPLFERKIVDTDTCNACHDRLEFHGGPRTDVEYCVTCHNPHSTDEDTGNTVDMKALIHNIHSARTTYQIVGYGGSEHDWSDLVWPQDIRNCQTCHEETDTNTPQASNWRLVQNRAACGTCHYDDGIDDNGKHDFAIEDGIHPFDQEFADDTQCAICHGPDSDIAGGAVRVATVHAIPEAVAALAFEYKVVSVSNSGPGQMPTVGIQVLNPTDPNYDTDPASTAYDINDPAGPFQTGSARLRVDIAWNTDDFGNVDPNNELLRSATSGQPFAPIDIDFKSGASTTDGITFTKAATQAIPSTATGSGMAILEGRPQVLIDGSLESIPVAASGKSFAITDSSAQNRRKVVDIDKCNDCHKNLALHGDNRSGNTEVCSTCHNPNATDVRRRVPGSDCEAELGLVEESIDLKRMVHGIHSGAVGLCGYGNSDHSYFGVVYPGHLNNCEGCHLAGEYYPVDPSTVLGTTINTGADRSTLLDDVVISPNASVCSSCHEHKDMLATEHMKQNGGDFDAQKDASGALIADGVETCDLCHGQGRSADVVEMHRVGDFKFN
jgi:OmcA/MtrC family decaheme c-type cytochrome